MGGQETAAGSFYFGLTARKEKSPTSILGPSLGQIAEWREFRRKYSGSFKRRKRPLADGTGVPDIVKMLRTVTSSQSTFM